MGNTIRTNFTNASPIAVDHAAHHNQVAGLANGTTPWYVSGLVYNGQMQQGAMASINMALGFTYYVACRVFSTVSINALCCRALDAPGGANGLYIVAANPATGLPTTAVVVNTTPQIFNTAGTKTFPCTATLQPGFYWMAFCVGLGANVSVGGCTEGLYAPFGGGTNFHAPIHGLRTGNPAGENAPSSVPATLSGFAQYMLGSTVPLTGFRVA